MGESKRIRDAVHQVDGETAIDQVKTLQQVVDDSGHRRVSRRGCSDFSRSLRLLSQPPA